jgi:hypothetical protein
MIKQRLPQKGTLDKAQPRDLFQTPNYATELLVPFISKSVRIIWECAAGERKIANILDRYNYTIVASDIRDGLPDVQKMNFLTEESSFDIGDKEVAIITNPPYSLKRQFFQKCIEYDLPFALLISGDYSLWTIDAIRKYGCEKVVPDHRINFITPTGLSEATGHSSYFHSYWLTRYFDLGKSETFVELTKEMRKNI